jgi:hypothetical protein
MQGFEFLIPIVLFTFLFLLASRMIKNRHERKKWELVKGENAGENSLTTSELQLMIEDAVAKATADLEDRLERLERPLLEAPPDEPYVAKTLGRQPTH